MFLMKFIESDLMKGIIKKHIIDERLKTRKERGKYFYASEGYLPDSSDSVCPRQLAYKISGYPEAVREEMYPIFAIGDLLHNFIQNIFVKEKLATQIEEFSIIYDDDGKHFWIRKDANKIIIVDPVEIHGRLDLKFTIDKTKFIADIKSINEKAWSYLNNKPKESHYSQMQLYLHHLKKEGITQGFLLYINKSTGDMKEFLLQYDEEYVFKLLDNYKRLSTLMKEKLPDRIFKSGEEVRWQCDYCGFTKECLGYSLEELSKHRFIVYPENRKVI